MVTPILAPLTDIAISSVKPTDKQYVLYNESGDFLIVTPKCREMLTFQVCLEGTEKLLSMETSPEVLHKDKRERHDEHRKQVAAGIDASAHRNTVKLTAKSILPTVFKAVS